MSEAFFFALTRLIWLVSCALRASDATTVEVSASLDRSHPERPQVQIGLGSICVPTRLAAKPCRDPNHKIWHSLHLERRKCRIWSDHWSRFPHTSSWCYLSKTTRYDFVSLHWNSFGILGQLHSRSLHTNQTYSYTYGTNSQGRGSQLSSFLAGRAKICLFSI